tara:strand:+ start:5722 stop:6837 length:1116 start_codon:yes stop_codon:yes gene_type:complete
MNIAFYAPMKSPRSFVPSGDRRVARALIEALELKGHSVDLASEFHAREPVGDATRQSELKAQGEVVADRLIAKYRLGEHSPDLWFTYHIYYKAIDWIGPRVAAELGIPYVAAEVSYAPKRAGGAWDFSHQALGEAIKQADAIIGLNSLDRACVLPLLDKPELLVQIKPFVAKPKTHDREEARSDLIKRLNINSKTPIMVTVGMMREDAKLQSYKVLGQTMARLENDDIHLVVIGDGPARAEVERHVGNKQTTYLGELAEEDIRTVYSGSDLFIWPAVNEAYGMAMLEAQAMGLPVVAGDAGGVSDIVRDGQTGYLCPEGDAEALAEKIKKLLIDTQLRDDFSKQAIVVCNEEHSLATAAQTLDHTLRALIS